MNAISKNLLRQKGREIRDSISQSQHEGDSARLKDQIIKFLDTNFFANHVIGAYYPIGSEIISPFVIPRKQSEQRNLISLTYVQDDTIKTALPVIRNKTTLEFYIWVAGDPLAKKDFDIPIPDTRGKTPIAPDILLLPLLLCDMHGNRIGYGAGHYDRYIASCDEKPLLIGVCFEEQIYDDVIPHEPHDQPLDLIVTPKRVIEIA